MDKRMRGRKNRKSYTLADGWTKECTHKKGSRWDRQTYITADRRTKELTNKEDISKSTGRRPKEFAVKKVAKEVRRGRQTYITADRRTKEPTNKEDINRSTGGRREGLKNCRIKNVVTEVRTE